jgi:hypothetical protein
MYITVSSVQDLELPNRDPNQGFLLNLDSDPGSC